MKLFTRFLKYMQNSKILNSIREIRGRSITKAA